MKRRLLTSIWFLAAMLAAPAALADETCTFADGVVTLTTDVGEDGTYWYPYLHIVQAGAALEFRVVQDAPIDCGGATVDNTHTVNVTMTSTDYATLVIDLSGGAFAPAGTTGGVVFDVDMSSAQQDTILEIRGRADDDTIRGGTDGVDYDGDEQVDVRGDTSALSLVVFYGGAGDDDLLGGGGAGTGTALPAELFAHGGGGADTIGGTRGRDLLSGGAGDDRLFGRGGSDWLNGDDGDDELFGGARSDSLHGDAGQDRLVGQAGHDNIRGGDGDDRLSGHAGDDRLLGEAGADRLSGGAGKDHLDGMEGADLLLSGPDADLFIGGYGHDTVSYASATAAVDVTLDGVGNDGINGGVLPEGDRVQRDIEVLVGSRHGDVLSGNDEAAVDELLVGRGGDDVLMGQSGWDRLVGGGGADALHGGRGGDEMAGGAGDDTATGAAGPDTISGGAGADLIRGGDGSDLLRGQLGDDQLDGGAEHDLCRGGEGRNSFTACECVPSPSTPAAHALVLRSSARGDCDVAAALGLGQHA